MLKFLKRCIWPQAKQNWLLSSDSEPYYLLVSCLLLAFDRSWASYSVEFFVFLAGYAIYFGSILSL